MKTKIWAVLLALLLVVSLAASSFLLAPRDAAAYAEISSDGTVIATWDLSKDDSLTVTFGDGYNHIDLKDGKIAVTEASCPDHLCMQRGYCNSGAAIVCLPNRLVIQFVGEQTIDGVVG